MKLKVNSNPYLKKIKYSIYDNKSNDWKEIDDRGNKLLSSKFSDSNLENIIDDIILYVKDAYLTNEDNNIEIVYEGTIDEYTKLANIIQLQDNIKFNKSNKFLDSKNEIISSLVSTDNNIRNSFHFKNDDVIDNEVDCDKIYKSINDKLCQIEAQTNNYVDNYQKLHNKLLSDFIGNNSDEYKEFFNKALENFNSYVILLREEIENGCKELTLNGRDLFSEEVKDRVVHLYHMAVEEMKLDLNDLLKKYDKDTINFNLFFNDDKNNEKNLRSKSLENLQELLTTNDILFEYSYTIDIYYLAYMYFIECIKDALIAYNKIYNYDDAKINELINNMYGATVNKLRNLRVIDYINRYKTKLISIFDAK